MRDTIFYALVRVKYPVNNFVDLLPFQPGRADGPRHGAWLLRALSGSVWDSGTATECQRQRFRHAGESVCHHGVPVQVSVALPGAEHPDCVWVSLWHGCEMTCLGVMRGQTSSPSFGIQMFVVVLSKSELCSPGQSPPAPPGLSGSPVTSLSALPLRPCPASESVLGWTVLKNVYRGLKTYPTGIFINVGNLGAKRDQTEFYALCCWLHCITLYRTVSCCIIVS